MNGWNEDILLFHAKICNLMAATCIKKLKHFYHCAAFHCILTTVHKLMENGNSRYWTGLWFVILPVKRPRSSLLDFLFVWCIVWFSTTEQFFTLAKSIANELWLREDDCITGFLFLHNRALTCIYGWHSKLCSQTFVSESVPDLIQWFLWQTHACF